MCDFEASYQNKIVVMTTNNNIYVTFAPTKNGLNEMNKQTDKVQNLYKCNTQKVEPTNVTPADFSSNKYHKF